MDEKIATTVFVDPKARINQDVYSRLSEIGFRRSGQHLYRPQCGACQECIPVRIPATDFTPTRQQKRCLKANSDIEFAIVDSIDSVEHYALYERYITIRHQDGDMYPPSRSQYDSFLTSEWDVTKFIEMRLKNKLIGVAVIDQLDHGISAVYTFFEPDLHQRSLGTYAILLEIQLAIESGLPYVYLGYWIRNCAKMNYKTKFKPLEVYQDNQWQELDNR